MAQNGGKIISFRVDGEQLSELEEISKREGVSTHEWAKRAMIDSLSGQAQIPKLVLQGEVIRQELLELRKDFAVATEGILVSGGKATHEQAARFVNANLRGK